MRYVLCAQMNTVTVHLCRVSSQHRDVTRDIALTKTVTIYEDGRERTVLISAEEYARLKRRDRRVISAGDLTGPPKSQRFRGAKVPDQHADSGPRDQRLEAVSFPEPYVGLVIRYSYLWKREFDAGREEGTKDPALLPLS